MGNAEEISSELIREAVSMASHEQEGISGELIREVVNTASRDKGNIITSQNEEIELQLDNLSEDSIEDGSVPKQKGLTEDEDDRSPQQEIVLMRDVVMTEDDGHESNNPAQEVPTVPARTPQAVPGSSNITTFLIGKFSFVHNQTIKICGMNFDVKFKDLTEPEFSSISGPQIPYRIPHQEHSSLNRIVKYGYDRRLPLIVCMDDSGAHFIVDGASRRADISEGLDSGKLTIEAGSSGNWSSDGIRIEPPIPVIFLENKRTTRMERLAISVALNTAIRLDQPLQLGDVVVSLGSFIQAKYYPNGMEIEISDLIALVDKITGDILTLELLHQFLETNTEHKDLAKKWTLETTPDEITTNAQVRSMNKFEEYKIYVKCAVGFLLSPNAYKLVFEKSDTARVQNRFDSQWTLSVFSHRKFISLNDDGKVLILACLATRQRMYGTPGVPFTTFQHALTLIDLMSDIYRKAFRSMNRGKFGKKDVPSNVFERALLTNHPDEQVRTEPYVKSIFYFMLNWKPNVRKFSKRAILTEVAKDISNWPSKRTWRNTESKVVYVLTDIWEVISRGMHAMKQASTVRRRSSGRLQKTKERRTQNVVSSLDNDEEFGNLIDMGLKLGVNTAVKRLTAGKRAQDNEQEDTPQDHQPDENESSVDIEEPQVSLTTVVKWARSMKNGGGWKDGPSSSSHGGPLEYNTYMSKEGVEKVSDLMKSLYSKNIVCHDIPKVFPKDSIWLHSIPKSKIEDLRDEYRSYSGPAMEHEGITYPENADDNARAACENVLFQCYNKLCREKIRSQGYVCFPDYFKDDSEEFIEMYLDYYEKKFDEKNIQQPWTSIKAGEQGNSKGRYFVDFDESTFADLTLYKILFKAKLITEIKLGVALEHILDDKDLKVESRGSFPIMHTEANDGTTPMYLHEIGRYADSKARKKHPEKPNYHLFVTGRTGFRIRVWEDSHFEEALPLKNRVKLCKRFSKVIIPIRPFSAVLIHGRLLFNFLSSTLEHDKFKSKRSVCLRMVLYDEDYDDDEDDSYFVSESHEDSDSDPNATLDDNELQRLKQPSASASSAGPSKKPKSKAQAQSSSENEHSEDDEDKEPSSESSSESSNEDSSSTSSDEQEDRPNRGRKGLSVLRKTPVASKKLSQDQNKETSKGAAQKPSEKGKGNSSTKMGTMKRRNSQLEVPGKGHTADPRAKKKPKK